MQLLKTLTRKLAVISIVFLAFLSFFIYSVSLFTTYVKRESNRIALVSQLRFRSFEMVWFVQRLVERGGEPLVPRVREDYLRTLGSEMVTFDRLLRDLEKDLGADSEHVELLPELKMLIAEWDSNQRPVLTQFLAMPAEAREAQGRELLRRYDEGIPAYALAVQKMVSFLEKDYKYDVERFRVFMLFILGCFTMVLVLAGIHVRRTVVKPVRRLRDAAREIQSGNFSVTVDSGTTDELGDLSSAFNLMTARLTEMFAETEKRAKDILAVSVASNDMIGVPDLQRLYNTICEGALKIYDLKLVWLCVVEEGTFALRPVAHAGAGEAYLSISVRWDDSPEGNGPTGIAIKERAPRMISDVGKDPSFAPWAEQARAQGFESVMAAPLICPGGRVAGALNCCSDKPDFFDAEKMELMQIYANQAAAAIDNAGMINSLERAVREKTRELEDARLMAESANLSKSNFLAGMSHELRSPLNVIIGFSEAMTAGVYGALSSRHAEYINHILESGLRLLSLIDSIMYLAKADTGGMTLEYRECSVSGIIDRAADLFREKAKKHGMTLDTETEKGLLTVTVDENKIIYVLASLLNHVLQNTPDGGRIGVSAKRLKDTGAVQPGTDRRADFVEFVVEGRGPAIIGEEHERLFRAFGSEDVPLTPAGEALRVSSALCRRFIEAHGGSIRLEYAPASEGEDREGDGPQKFRATAGTRVIFVLPQRPPHDKLIHDTADCP